MQYQKRLVIGLAGFVALALACGGHEQSPSSSSPMSLAGPSSVGAPNGSSSVSSKTGVQSLAPDLPPQNDADDGVTLKASVPTLQEPADDFRYPDVKTKEDIVTIKPVLVTGAATGTYASATFQYRFQVFGPTGDVLEETLQSGTSFTMTKTLQFNTKYTWRARAELDGAAGPWSGTRAFMTPAEPIPPPPPPPPAYIAASEIRDPLTIGRTVGVVHGPIEFIPGVGAKMLAWESYISYELPQTLVEGEFSLEITNLKAEGSGDKQKVMGMSEGYADIITNDRRMTVEKRSIPPGATAWRFITHDDQIETTGNAERPQYPFHQNLVYFYQATWRNNFFNVTIKEGGATGKVIYDFGKRWGGRPYDPKPHVIFVGVPTGRSGSVSATIENTIYRNIWVSAMPRPKFE